MSTIYARLRILEDAGLIAAVRVALDPGRSPRFFHLTDRGLAVIATVWARDSGELAREKGIRGLDLRMLLPGLAQLRATYTMLIALATVAPGDVEILSWEWSWRPNRARRRVARPVGVYPSLVTLSLDQIQCQSFLLLADRATFPVQLYQEALAVILRGQSVRRNGIPPLLVAAPPGGRVRSWENLLSALGRSRGVAFPAVRIATWDGLDNELAGVVGSSEARWSVLTPPDESPKGVQRLPVDGMIPRSVGPILPRSVDRRSARCHLAHLAATLRPAERALLDLLGRHPFLAPDDLAGFLGWSAAWTRERCRSLASRGLLRRVGAGEARSTGDDQLLEATVIGLSLIAAHQSLGLAAAVRHNGLTGGGPDHPVGSRRILLANLEHTRGVDTVFIRLVDAARATWTLGGDDALLEWRNAAACAHGSVRPDGYGVYRHNGHRYGFFLEYDRATTGRRDYREKFAAYTQYRESGRFERDYLGFPSILIVTTGPGTEARIVREIQAIGRGRPAPLPVLLTTTTRITADPMGMLGPIWREEGGPARRRWMREHKS